MTLTPFLEAPLIIQAHVLASVPALLVGPVTLFRSRRDRVHKWLGYVWITSMAMLALTGLAIPNEDFAVLGRFGPIHLLSLLALWGLASGLLSARKGDIASHRSTMRILWFGALSLTGLFTLAPGRVMHAVLIGGPGISAWVIIGVGLVALAALWVAVPTRYAGFRGAR